MYDNARPHIAKSMRDQLLKLGWVTVSHPPYSPDLAPMDYHLYRSLSNHLFEKNFDDENDLKMLERWEQVIDSNGAYILER